MNKARYELIKHLPWRNDGMIRKYAKNIYYGWVDPEWGLSAEDICLLCDHGVADFGGDAKIEPDGKFVCVVYTD